MKFAQQKNEPYKLRARPLFVYPNNIKQPILDQKRNKEEVIHKFRKGIKIKPKGSGDNANPNKVLVKA